MTCTLPLARALSLSREARLFFYATSLVHVALKILLGMTLVLEDGYGFNSMLAPPISAVFAGGDIAFCFGLSKLLDATLKPRWTQLVHRLVLWLLAPFLVANFIVHQYLKTFVNRGLLEFNGAGTSELADYAIAGASVWSLSFAALALGTALCFTVAHAKLLQTRLLESRAIPVWVLLGGVAAMVYAGSVSAGQSGFLRKNPAYQLTMSYMEGHAHAIARATPAQVRAFRAPKPLFGTYHPELDVSVPSQRGKNVLFVLIESLPLEQTPLLGGEGGLTVLDELARDGVTFTNFRTVFPATSRSFLSYHCGIYPTAGDATATKYMPGYRCESLLDSLKQAGYRTGFFTAPMFTYDNLHKAEVMRGYDVYADYLTMHQRVDTAFDAPAVPEEVVAERVLQFVRAPRSQPFFATYFMFWNHAPYRLPHEDISALTPLQRYRRTLHYLDSVLRDLLAQMREDHILDDTLVVVAADHGEGFALHHDNRNHVGHLYEDDVRIPLLLHVPGLGRHVTARSGTNVDFAPTLAALLEVPKRPSWQGQDLLSSAYEPRPALLFSRSSFAANAIVDGNYKYIEYPDSTQRYLFDVERDPNEQQNLLPGEKAKADAYRELISHWLPVADYQGWAVSR